jgi:phosphatidylglycerophosphate synthase
VPTVRNGPAIGLVGQIVLLVALAGTVGLGAAGWLVGLASGVVTMLVLGRGLDRAGTAVLAPADWVTLIRAGLSGGVAALTIESFYRPPFTGVLVGLAAVALALDAVDGLVARLTGTATALGARFDMEVDSFLLLVLSVYAARSLGAWVLMIGAMRYAFVAAMWVLPWMRASLPPRYWRKVVAAAQGIVLVVAAAEVLAGWLTVTLVGAALALLCESFGRDVRWLWHHRLVRVRA